MCWASKACNNYRLGCASIQHYIMGQVCKVHRSPFNGCLTVNHQCETTETQTSCLYPQFNTLSSWKNEHFASIYSSFFCGTQRRRFKECAGCSSSAMEEDRIYIPISFWNFICSSLNHHERTFWMNLLNYVAKISEFWQIQRTESPVSLTCQNLCIIFSEQQNFSAVFHCVTSK